MSTRLYAKLIEAGFIKSDTVETGQSYALYLRNQLTANKRVCVTNHSGETTTLNSYPVANNNATVSIEDALVAAKVCLTPNKVISCSGATALTILTNFSGLYTIEFDGHTVLEAQTIDLLSLAVTDNIYCQDAGLSVLEVNQLESTDPLYFFYLDNSMSEHESRVKIRYAATTATQPLAITPEQAATLTGISLNEMPSSSNNPTIGIDVTEVNFCLKSSLVVPVCYQFSEGMGTVIDSNDIAMRRLNIFPNTTNYQINDFTISINGESAVLTYVEVPSVSNPFIADAVYTKSYWQLKTSNRTYKWDVSDYNIVNGTRKHHLGWVRDEVLSVEDAFILCYNKPLTVLPASASPYVDHPIDGVHLNTDNLATNVKLHTTWLSQKHYSVSAYGIVEYLKWLLIPSTLSVRLKNAAKDTYALPVSQSNELTLTTTGNTTDVMVEFPYQDLVNTQLVDRLSSYVLIELEDNFSNVAVAPTTVVLTITPQSGTPLTFTKQNILDTAKRTTDNKLTLPLKIYNQQSGLLTYTLAIDYDGTTDKNYLTGTYTINVNIAMLGRELPFNIQCTGLQDDVALLGRGDQMYTVIVDGVPAPQLLTYTELTAYLDNVDGLEVIHE